MNEVMKVMKRYKKLEGSKSSESVSLSSAHSTTPSPALTGAFFIALTTFFFTSRIALVWPIALALLWAHFVPWRYARDASGAWLVRLLCYGGIFAFYGGQPGMGADWIFDAKTFNTIGLIAASEALLQTWREPPQGLRYQPLLVLQAGIIFLAACNTYDPRYVLFLAPLFIGSTLLALHDVRFRARDQKRWDALSLRRVLVLLIVIACGSALHFDLIANKDALQIWGLRLMRQRIFQTAGISNQPTLGPTFNLQGTTRRVLRIEGALNETHFRVASFDTYSGGRWSPPLAERAKESFPETTTKDVSSPHTLHITKLTDLDHLIPAPLNTAAIVPQEGSTFDWDKTLGPLRCDDPAPYSYDITSSDEDSNLGMTLHQGALCSPPSQTERRKLLDVPSDIDPRVRQLARRITAQAPNAADKIEAIVTYLMTHNKYARTTRRGRGDPVSSFLLERKAAHCEYFASAATLLLRCADIPARYATGFLAHETEGDITTVRQRDAHAWTEAYVSGLGWIVVDATPADGTPAAEPPVSWFQRKWEALQDRFAHWRESIGGVSRPQLFGFISLVALIGLWERWRQARKRKLQETALHEYATPAELAALATRFETLLKQQHIVLPQGTPWSEYFEDERTAPIEYKPFIAAYNRVRFGNEGASTPRALQDELDRLEKSQKKGNRHGNHHENSDDTHRITKRSADG
jgi:transglutaminase-like putative cysteine protease